MVNLTSRRILVVTVALSSAAMFLTALTANYSPHPLARTSSTDTERRKSPPPEAPPDFTLENVKSYLSRMGYDEMDKKERLRLLRSQKERAKAHGCVHVTSLGPPFAICPHDFPDLISDKVRRQEWHESIVLSLLMGMLEETAKRNFPAGRNKSLPVVLDGGANLGSLSLPLLSRGYHVWAVEPLTMNVERLRLAANLSHTLNKLKVAKGALGDGREGDEATMLINEKNVGSSMVAPPSFRRDRDDDSKELRHDSEETVKVLNLWDLLEKITDEVTADYARLSVSLDMVDVVVKLDVEGSVCRALTALGSEKIFSSSRIFVPYFLTEFSTKNSRFHPLCPLPLELRAIDLLERNDYVPHTLQGEPMEINRELGIVPDNVIWRHKTMRFPERLHTYWS